MRIIDRLLRRKSAQEPSLSKKKAEPWTQRWAIADQRPAMNDWRLPPGARDPSVVAAVESGWLVPGSRVLDLGCGDGAVAAYLTGAGFDAVGIDFAPSAIERARSQYGDLERLRFEVADVVSFRDEAFEALVDRGCYHGLSNKERELYLKTVLALTRPGSKFLLLNAIKEGRHGERGEQIEEEFIRKSQQLKKQFAPSFEIEAVERTVINGRGDIEDTGSVPAILMRMTRR